MKISKKVWIPASVILLTGISYMAFAAFSSYETPEYVVEQKSGSFELRNYAPQLLAVVEVQGDRSEASSKGFRLLADYIFGNNLSSESIEMTTPVTQQPKPQKIAMTTPVTQESKGTGTWEVTFKMPKEYTLDNIPRPQNKAVRLVEVPASRYVAYRFSGYTGDQKVVKKQKELQQWAADAGHKLTGEPLLARYDPPWNPPFVRRNEILWRVQD